MREKAGLKGWRRTGFALALLAVPQHVGVCTSSSSFSHVDQESGLLSSCLRIQSAGNH